MNRRRFIRSLSRALSVFSFDQLVRGLPLGVQFVNVARQAGLNTKTTFGGEHTNKYLLETTGCGAASTTTISHPIHGRCRIFPLGAGSEEGA